MAKFNFQTKAPFKFRQSVPLQNQWKTVRKVQFEKHLRQKLWLVIMVLVPSLAGAHREHAAHVHGGAQLSIAFDQALGRAEFKAAADGILGFEHPAKSVKDKKIVQETATKFENEIAHLIVFDPSLNCQFQKEKLEQVAESAGSNHSDYSAVFRITCSKSPKGSRLKIDFSQFAKIKDLDVTVLADDLQKTAEAKGKAIEIELKP